MTLASIADAMKGRLEHGGPDREVTGFSIDSRTLKPGDLFFAIRGDRFDGHAFVADALRAGAAGAVVAEAAVAQGFSPADAGRGVAQGFSPVRIEGTNGALIVVQDTLLALQQLATHVRRTSGVTVVAVTGSAGKSTTKEISAEFLSARYRVFRNKGNLNNHIGLPLSLLELRHRPDIAVVELGMNHAGEISALVRMAEPEVRVWTNVGPAHLEFFESVDAIADAKAEIMEGAGRDDLLVANADDERVMARAEKFSGRVRTFGITQPADVRALAVNDLGIDGTAAMIRTPAGDAEIRTSLPGQANLANILAATAVALRFDVPLADIVQRAAALKPVARRGEVIRCGGVTILDDSYNSNPKALSSALAMLKDETRYARRVAVIGEMLELGEEGPALHRQAGKEAAEAGIAVLIAVGGAAARELADGAVAGGMDKTDVHYVPNSADAAVLAARIVKAGDLVVVKGSRGVRTETVVDRLKAELA
jgi:UDP-N-acetylmuramoyl-tripeptide--D-alanyl-D-alanine ligase